MISFSSGLQFAERIGIFKYLCNSVSFELSVVTSGHVAFNSTEFQLEVFSGHRSETMNSGATWRDESRECCKIVPSFTWYRSHT